MEKPIKAYGKDMAKEREEIIGEARETLSLSDLGITVSKKLFMATVTASVIGSMILAACNMTMTETPEKTSTRTSNDPTATETATVMPEATLTAWPTSTVQPTVIPATSTSVPTIASTLTPTVAPQFKAPVVLIFEEDFNGALASLLLTSYIPKIKSWGYTFTTFRDMASVSNPIVVVFAEVDWSRHYAVGPGLKKAAKVLEAQGIPAVIGLMPNGSFENSGVENIAWVKYYYDLGWEIAANGIPNMFVMDTTEGRLFKELKFLESLIKQAISGVERAGFGKPTTFVLYAGVGGDHPDLYNVVKSHGISVVVGFQIPGFGQQSPKQDITKDPPYLLGTILKNLYQEKVFEK